MTTTQSGVRHLYVHLPFCVHRCGYCDFVTLVGREASTGATSTRCSPSSSASGSAARRALETFFLGGGTPTFTEPAALARLLARSSDRPEVTVEANPETVTPELAALLRETGSTASRSARRASSRAAGARAARRPGRRPARVRTSRDAGFDNISLDLLYGIPGQSAADLDRDLAEALALAPEHLSCYELEAKPGTRFTHALGGELERQAEAMEGYFEHVVETLTAPGFRWYETANFCRRRAGSATSARNTTLATGADTTTSGSVSGPSRRSVGAWRNAPAPRGYLALGGGRAADRARSRRSTRSPGRGSG